MQTIDGIVLAAGASRRMGRPKAALMTADGESFLTRTTRTLRRAGCRRVVAVVNSSSGNSGAVPELEAHDLNVEMVVNPAAGSEQIDSLRLALERLDDSTDAALVLPVDLPLIMPETVGKLVASFRERPAAVIVPSHDGVAGHPVLLARAMFAEIVHGTWEEGMRSFLLAHARDVRMVSVDDPGILIDIDTPDDYLRHVAPS